MPTCMKTAKRLIFDAAREPDDNWVRFDATPDGITVDRSGVYHLSAAECRELACWLIVAAEGCACRNSRVLEGKARSGKCG